MRERHSRGSLELLAGLSVSVVVLVLGCLLLARGTSWKALLALVATHEPSTRSHGSLLLLFAPSAVLSMTLHKRRQAKDALRESEERFRSMAETASDAVITFDEQEKIIFWNWAAELMFGHPSEAALGRTLGLILPPGSRSQILAEMRRVASEERPARVAKTIEISGVHASGQTLPLQISVARVRAGGGDCFTVIIRDTTEQRTMEEALRESEERYRTLVECSPDATFVLAGTRIAFANSAGLKLLGATTREELAAGPGLVVPPDGGVTVDAAGAAEARQEPRLTEARVERLDGGVVDLELAAAPFVHHGEPAVLVVARDVTERRKGEQERARLTLAIEQAGEAIMITETDGTIVFVNPTFERVTGYSTAEVLGQNPRILKSGKQDASFYQTLWSVIANGGVWRGQLVNRRKDGSLYEEEAVISPVRDGSGRVVNYVAVKRDVTHEREMEEELRHAKKIEAVGQLAGGLAHDFNNLLTAVLGAAELLQRRLALQGDDPKELATIQRTAQRAAELTRRLLDFARRQILKSVDLDLNEAVREALPMLRRVIPENITIDFIPSGDPGIVHMDTSQIDQLLMNLSVNSRDAMAAGGTITILTENVAINGTYVATHSWARPGDYVCLSVSDTGVGMDAEVMAHIFEPFFTTKEPGKGTGLGLATVYGIVNQQGGMIYAYSEPGEGTTFKVYLPRVGHPATQGRSEGGSAPPGGSESILVVEDETEVRHIIAQVLSALGYRVTEAADGIEALEALRRDGKSIDLVITDVVMPRMGGEALAEAASELAPQARFLFSSGYGAGIVKSGPLTKENVFFLSKPYGIDTLARKVREVLDGGTTEAL